MRDWFPGRGGEKRKEPGSFPFTRRGGEKSGGRGKGAKELREREKNNKNKGQSDAPLGTEFIDSHYPGGIHCENKCATQMWRSPGGGKVQQRDPFSSGLSPGCIGCLHCSITKHTGLFGDTTGSFAGSFHHNSSQGLACSRLQT